MEKSGKFVCWRPHRRVGAPFYEESWIRPCNPTGLFTSYDYDLRMILSNYEMWVLCVCERLLFVTSGWRSWGWISKIAFGGHLVLLILIIARGGGVTTPYPLDPLQWRIQDFPGGGDNSQSGCAYLFFCRKWKKMKEFGPRRGVPGASLDPSMLLCVQCRRYYHQEQTCFVFWWYIPWVHFSHKMQFRTSFWMRAFFRIEYNHGDVPASGPILAGRSKQIKSRGIRSQKDQDLHWVPLTMDPGFPVGGAPTMGGGGAGDANIQFFSKFPKILHEIEKILVRRGRSLDRVATLQPR